MIHIQCVSSSMNTYLNSVRFFGGALLEILRLIKCSLSARWPGRNLSWWNSTQDGIVIVAILPFGLLFHNLGPLQLIQVGYFPESIPCNTGH